MPINWSGDNTAYRKLLGLIVNHPSVKLSGTYEDLAHGMGDDCTPKAIVHKIAQLRKEAEAGGPPASPSGKASGAAIATPSKSGSTAGKNSPGGPSTPRNKRAVATAPKSPRKRKRTLKMEDEDDDDSDEVDYDAMDHACEDEDDTPTKRVKRGSNAKAKSAFAPKAIKAEAAAEEDIASMNVDEA